MQVRSLDFCFSIKEETLQFAEKQGCGAFRGGGHIRTSVLDYHFLKLSSVDWSPWPETQVTLGTGGHLLVGDGGVLHPDPKLNLHVGTAHFIGKNGLTYNMQ